MLSKMKASVALLQAFVVSDWHRHATFVLVALLLTAVTPISAFAKAEEGWKIFTDSDEKIQFLSIKTPKKQKVDGPVLTKTIWHIGFLEDGTNGYVEVTRLNQGSFIDFDVLKQSKNLRKGLEGSGKLKVTAENPINIAGRRAIEFKTLTVSSNGMTWHGKVRMVVIDNAIYTISIVVPKPSLLLENQIVEFLSSLKKID